MTDEEVLRLTDFALAIEAHYSTLAGKATPMDIEWARDGIDGELYIVQARPETVASQQDASELVRYRLKGTGDPLVRGSGNRPWRADVSCRHRRPGAGDSRRGRERERDPGSGDR